MIEGRAVEVSHVPVTPVTPRRGAGRDPARGRRCPAASAARRAKIWSTSPWGSGNRWGGRRVARFACPDPPKGEGVRPWGARASPCSQPCRTGQVRAIFRAPPRYVQGRHYPHGATLQQRYFPVAGSLGGHLPVVTFQRIITLGAWLGSLPQLGTSWGAPPLPAGPHCRGWGRSTSRQGHTPQGGTSHGSTVPTAFSRRAHLHGDTTSPGHTNGREPHPRGNPPPAEAPHGTSTPSSRSTPGVCLTVEGIPHGGGPPPASRVSSVSRGILFPPRGYTRRTPDHLQVIHP